MTDPHAQPIAAFGLGPLRAALILFDTLALLACTGWIVARLVGDRTELGQYAAYIPGLWVTGPALVLALLAGLAAMAHAWLRRAAGLPRGRYLFTTVAAALCAVSFGCVLVVDLRITNAFRSPVHPLPPARSFRVLHWNTGSMWKQFWPEMLEAIPNDPPPDLVCLSNPPKPTRLEGLAQRLGEGAEVHFVGDFAFASTRHLLARGVFPLAIPPATSRTFPTFLPEDSIWQRAMQRVLPLRLPTSNDSGDIAFAVFDTTPDLGRPLTVWNIDLPSDPRVPRHIVARVAAGVIRSLMAEGKLPPPDVVVGDFNIPRGSWTLEQILAPAGPLEHAFDQASWGLVASWPRSRPFLHIDHSFLAPWICASEYRLLDGGVSDHFFQVFAFHAR